MEYRKHFYPKWSHAQSLVREEQLWRWRHSLGPSSTQSPYNAEGLGRVYAFIYFTDLLSWIPSVPFFPCWEHVWWEQFFSPEADHEGTLTLGPEPHTDNDDPPHQILLDISSLGEYLISDQDIILIQWTPFLQHEIMVCHSEPMDEFDYQRGVGSSN